MMNKKQIGKKCKDNIFGGHDSRVEVGRARPKPDFTIYLVMPEPEPALLEPDLFSQLFKPEKIRA
jgi:hypothetical protein